MMKTGPVHNHPIAPISETLGLCGLVEVVLSLQDSSSESSTGLGENIFLFFFSALENF